MKKKSKKEKFCLKRIQGKNCCVKEIKVVATIRPRALFEFLRNATCTDCIFKSKMNNGKKYLILNYLMLGYKN